MEEKHILIVDDYLAMRNSIRESLAIKEQYKVSDVSNGQEALTFCLQNKVDLVITDWNMPVMNGLELIRNIRHNEAIRHIPILMVSAETNQEHFKKAILEGVNGFVVKPFSVESLHLKLEMIFSGKSPALKSSVTASDIKKKPVTSISTEDENEQATILVVDDLPANIDVIVGVLKTTYNIKVATKGAKALDIVAKHPMPDLILLDIMMPEMDGFEVCKRLKSDPITAQIPIIFLTAKTDIDTTVQGFASGAVDYITKPVNSQLLMARVNNHIQLKQSQQQLKNQVDTLLENARLREDVEWIARHDIKNPLSLIINETTELSANQFISSKYRKKIDDVGKAALVALQMVNSSLDLYKMETNSYQLDAKPVDIIQVLTRIKNDLSHLTNSNAETNYFQIDIKFNSKKFYKVLGEELLCYSLFSNLIKNALEASANNEKIVIEVADESNIVVTIHNQTEVPAEIQSHFFDKYVTSGKKEGTGLGTYSARLMTKVQSGCISYTTSKQQGTTVTVELPKWSINTSN